MSHIRAASARSWHMSGVRMTVAGPTGVQPPVRPTRFPVLLGDTYPFPERLPGALFRVIRPDGAPGPALLKLPTGIHRVEPTPGRFGNRLFSAAAPDLEIRRKLKPDGGLPEELPPALVDLHKWQSPDGNPYEYKLVMPSDLAPAALSLVPHADAVSYLVSDSGLGAEILVNPESALIVPSSTYTGWQPLPASLGLSTDTPTLRLTTPQEFTDLCFDGYLPLELANLIHRRTGPSGIKSNFRLLVLSLGIATSEKYGIEVLGVTENEGNLTVHYRKTSRTGSSLSSAGGINPIAFILVSNRYFPSRKKVEVALEKFGI